ncbi:transglycosylase domain-containing protein [Streptomyces sp. NPDC059740]|uniref:transglycosylase domain-containing protein n=1 Tax=Streptomyces sp. NPDC059740 TaxID=3346926 RepID=UPI0036649ADD
MANKREGGGLTRAQQVAKFLGVSVVTGVVLAGLALPAAGALGLAAKGTVEGFDHLPANLKTPPLSQRTTILDSQGGEIAKVYFRDRTVVPLKQVSPYMQKAIVAIEDSRFYQHGAVDLKGVLRALNKNAQSGGVSQGASTLTQQYVKNVFIEEARNDPDKVAQATKQTVGRKITELKYAIQLEKELGKKRILQNYLNITFFGEQAYGVEAASQRYFSKHAEDLDLPEAALLAGIVQSPSRYDPVNDMAEATHRRNTVLERMAQLHDITRQQADAAEKTPITLHVSQPRSGCISATHEAGFFCDYVRNVFLSDPAFGATRKARNKRWDEGGMTIRTTLDPKAQQSVEASLRKHVYASDPVASAAALVEPGTGKVKAMGQSRPYGFKVAEHQTQVNYSVDHDMGGSDLGFLPGSTFKPVVAASALEQGVSPELTLSAPYRVPYPHASTCKGRWEGSGTVPNEDKDEKGPYSMKEATAKSINTYFIQLIDKIGICPVVQMADKMGIKHQASGKPLDQVPSIALGTQGMSPLTMASAYATFANDGKYCTPVAIESITDADGKAMKVPQTTCSQAMSAKTAHTVNTLLKGVVEDGTGTQAGLTGRDSAGKTGTTDERWSAWFVGYTKDLAGAVWVGDPEHKRKMIDITIGGVPHDKVYGADTPGPIWRDAMNGALSGKAPVSLPTVPIGKGKAKGGHGGHQQKPPADNAPTDPGGNHGPDLPDLPDGVLGGNDGGFNWPGGGGHNR